LEIPKQIKKWDREKVIEKVIAISGYFYIINETISNDLAQWKLLNVITLGQTETDNTNRMITISSFSNIKLT
jgi:hypothetical protein